MLPYYGVLRQNARWIFDEHWVKVKERSGRKEIVWWLLAREGSSHTCCNNTSVKIIRDCSFIWQMLVNELTSWHYPKRLKSIKYITCRLVKNSDILNWINVFWLSLSIFYCINHLWLYYITYVDFLMALSTFKI